MVMMVTVAVIVSVISDRKYASAKSYSEGGTWKKTIDEMTWYISISEYSSAEGKELGNARIYKGKKAYNKNSSIASGEYVKVGTNKYKLKYKGGKIVFQVYEKKIKLKKKRGKLMVKNWKVNLNLLRDIIRKNSR